MVLVQPTLDRLIAWCQGEPEAPAPAADTRVVAKARALATALAPHMAAARLALEEGFNGLHDPAAQVARRLAAKARLDQAFREELERACATYRRLLAELDGPGPAPETVLALGSLAFAWRQEPAFQQVYVLEIGTVLPA